MVRTDHKDSFTHMEQQNGLIHSFTETGRHSAWHAVLLSVIVWLIYLWCTHCVCAVLLCHVVKIANTCINITWTHCFRHTDKVQMFCKNKYMWLVHFATRCFNYTINRSHVGTSLSQYQHWFKRGRCSLRYLNSGLSWKMCNEELVGL